MSELSLLMNTLVRVCRESGVSGCNDAVVEQVTELYYNIDVSKLLKKELKPDWDLKILESVRGGHVVVVSAVQGFEELPIAHIKLKSATRNESERLLEQVRASLETLAVTRVMWPKRVA